MARRTIAWSQAMRDLQRDRVAPTPGPSPMFVASLERARKIEARKAAQAAAEQAPKIRMSPCVVYLLAARHNRLCALACPDEADLYKSRARYWLGLAGVARRAEGSRLP
jgi:hypothetical protein